MARTQASGQSATSGTAPTGSAGGDLTGTYPNPTLNIDGKTGKTTPADADEMPLADSAASFATKKLTWANLKATVKAYTDTLYPAGSGTSTGTNTGDQTSVSGNAGTATALATSRNIDGQAFDGTANITVIAPGTHAATAKSTPVDADEFPIVDSAASNVLKKYTGTNLKAYLKTYFDTLYQATGSVSTVFTRTGAVVAASGDYTAAQVTNAADKSSSSSQGFTAGITSAHATQGVGYATGAGGAVTQLTSRTTAVTINKISGAITTFNSSMSTDATASFTVNNTAVAAGDVVLVSCRNDATTALFIPAYAGQVSANSFVVTYANNSSGTVSTAFVFNFVVIKAVSA